MPRKMRPGKARRGTGIPVSAALFSYLVWGDWDAAVALAEPGASKWELFDGIGEPSHENAWRAIVDAALEAWVETYPGTRPDNWWRWSAPELRQVWGRFTPCVGRGRCQPSGLPYGEPADWTDRPMCETPPAYLERLGLWLDGERARVPAAAFDPQPFSWDLTMGS